MSSKTSIVLWICLAVAVVLAVPFATKGCLIQSIALPLMGIIILGLYVACLYYGVLGANQRYSVLTATYFPAMLPTMYLWVFSTAFLCASIKDIWDGVNTKERAAIQKMKLQVGGTSKIPERPTGCKNLYKFFFQQRA